MGLIWQVIYYQRRRNYQLEDGVYPEEEERTGLLNGSSSSAPSYSSTKTVNSRLSNTKETKKTKLLNWSSACAIVLVTVISCYTYYNAHWKKGNDGDRDDSHRMNWLPQTMGWTSAVLYIGSRIPQIVKNWKNKSTEGLSFGMFICAVLGNVLFTSVSTIIIKLI